MEEIYAGTIDPVGSTHTGAVHARLPPMGGTPHRSSGRMCEEGAEETASDELTTVLSPIPLRHYDGGGLENKDQKLGRRERWRCFKIWFSISLPYSNLIGNKFK